MDVSANVKGADELSGLFELVDIVKQVDSESAIEIRLCGERVVEFEHHWNYGEAAEECLSMLDFAPEVFEVYRYVALELKVFGKGPEAIEVSKKAIALDPSKPAGYELLGEVCYGLEQYHKARDAFRQAILLGANNLEVFLYLGHACLAVKQHEEAIEAYTKALQFKADDCEALSYLGRAYYEAGRYQETLTTITRCLEIGEDGNGLVQQLLGDTYYALGRFPEAISAYQKSLELHPRCPDCHLKLAQAYQSSGQNEEAEKYTQMSEQLILEADREFLDSIPF